MGLVYSSAESSNLIKAMSSNLDTAKSTISDLKSGSQRLIAAVDGRTLSGAAYNAGKGLFSELILPTISRVTTSMDGIQSDLVKYTGANAAISSEGFLDEDKLKLQIQLLKASKATLITSANAAGNLAAGNPIPGLKDMLKHTENRLNRMANSMQDDIDKVQKKIKKLHDFSSQTNGLFSTRLNELSIAMQGVLVLNNTIVSSDGSYQLPEGKDKSWFTEKKVADTKEFDVLKNKIKTDNLPTTKAEILRDYHWSTSVNMYVHTKTGKASVEVTTLYNKLVMIEHEPQYDVQLSFYNEMLKTGKHPVTGEPITEIQRGNARIMIYALALQPFVGAWAMAQVPKSYQPSSSTKGSKNGKTYSLDRGKSKGNVSYKKASGGKSTISLEMEDKILWGQRKNPNKNEIIGGHSSSIDNSHSNYATETVKINPDGTKEVKYTTQFPDGNLSKIKNSTVFPEGWGDTKILDNMKKIGDSSPISIRGRDGATFHRAIVDGVEIDVIKIGDNIISGYPTGQVNAPLPGGFTK